jgi:hypothetical protein
MRHSNSGLIRSILLFFLCTSATAASAVELVTNGSFESNGGVDTNTFTGWTESDQAAGSGSIFAQTGTTAPSLNPITVSAPPVGSFSAMSSQTGPGSHILYQNISVPGGSPAKFFAMVYVNNQGGAFATPASLDYTVSPNQQARIDIMTTGSAITDVGAGVLLNLYQTNVGDPLVSGYTNISVDLTPFAGQTVRLRIAEVDNTGNFAFGVDAVSVISTAPIPTLSDWALIGLGLAVLVIGFVAVRRRMPA